MELISQIFYRWDDAIIPAFGLNYNSITAVISYDINTSDLVAASQNKGGFEFSIIYMWNKKKRRQRGENKKYWGWILANGESSEIPYISSDSFKIIP